MKNKRKKKSKSNLGVLLIAVAIILLGGFGIYTLKNQEVDLDNNKTKDNNSIKEDNSDFNETIETEYLNNKLEEITSRAGGMASRRAHNPF